MKANITTIPHENQEYPTLGNWHFNGDSIDIEVSDMGSEDYAFLVGVHELVEAYLCRAHGISEQTVTDFDLAFEAKRVEGNTDEPGDDLESPYRLEHTTATRIEMMLAGALGIQWDSYEEDLKKL